MSRCAVQYFLIIQLPGNVAIHEKIKTLIFFSYPVFPALRGIHVWHVDKLPFRVYSVNFINRPFYSDTYIKYVLFRIDLKVPESVRKIHAEAKGNVFTLFYKTGTHILPSP